MNLRMVQFVKKNLRKVGRKTRPFYFVEERVREGKKQVLRRVLYVSEKKLTRPKYNTLDKINGHLARKAKDEPFSKKARLCAGLVCREEEGLRFEIVVRKGVGSSQLLKALRKLNTEKKLGIPVAGLSVGKAAKPGREGTSRKPRAVKKTKTPVQRAVKINALFQRLRQHDPAPEAGVEKLIRRLATYDDEGGEPGPVAEARGFAESHFARHHEQDEEDEVKVMEREVSTWISEIAIMEEDLAFLLESENIPEQTVDLAIAQVEGARRQIDETIARLQKFLDEED